MGDKSFETDFSNDEFFQRKQIQIDMLYWSRPSSLLRWSCRNQKSWKFWLLIPFLLGYATLYINQFD